MEILFVIVVLIAVYALIVARYAHKRLDKHQKIASLEAEAIWETLMSKELIDKSDFEFAMKIANDKLSSEKKS